MSGTSSDDFRRFWSDPEYLDLTTHVINAMNFVWIARNVGFQAELNETLKNSDDQDLLYSGIIALL